MAVPAPRRGPIHQTRPRALASGVGCHGAINVVCNHGVMGAVKAALDAAERAPIGELVDVMDVGFASAYLCTPFARRNTGGTIYVDGSVHTVA